MDFALISDIKGTPEVKNSRTKKAFLQSISDLIDECEASGAVFFDLILNTDISGGKKEEM